ncbi:PAS domain S-box protein [Longimicrobium terrae]|uniref:histidine kinase n=1 Tax=Longimicrobium terrae TaxID=1639882 RepID=A0A841GMD8_9BACT|nr:PAS domain S-box protein [Longimicrobium terrae]MBB4635557.1 PAS domain S-box-containing protein [Longimicrobium terrae]MBB6069951.1 PAS domain S-box-containing protein [Longimicrobium terrae]NNC32863.1 PAS domain S-box protein [Longimicrobium terrae]
MQNEHGAGPDGAEARERLLAGAARAFVWEGEVADGVLRVTRAGPGVEAVLGRDAGAWTAEAGLDPHAAPALARARLRAAVEGAGYAIQYTARHADGRLVRLRETGEPAGPGRMRAAVQHAPDDAALQEARRELMDQAPEGIVVMAGGRVSEFNARAADIFGGDLRGLALADLLDADELAARPFSLDELPRGETLLGERTIRRVDGGTAEVEISARVRPDGTIQAIVRDVTRRRAAERDADESRMRLLSLFELDPLPAYVFRVEPGGMVLEAVNQAARLPDGGASMLGETAEAIFADAPQIPAAIRQCAATGEPMRRETEYRFGGTGPRARVVITLGFVPPGRVVARLQDVTEQRALEQSIRSRDLTFQAISDAVYLADREGRIADWNPAAESLFGRSRSEMLGRMVAEVHGAEVMDRVTGPLLEALSTSDRWQGEMPYTRPDGTAGLADATVVALRDDEGALVGMIAAERDVTERRRAEDALRESEARFRAMFQNSAIGICVTSPDMRVMECNPAMAAMLGRDRDGLRGTSFAEFTHPADRAENVQRLNAVKRGEADHYTLEKRYLRPDGSVVWARLTASAVRDAASTLQYLIVMVEDVTEAHDALRAVREGEARFRDIASNVRDIFWIASATGEMLYVSPAVQRILGLPAAEMIADPARIITLIHPEDRRKVGRPIEERLVGETTREYRIVRGDGQMRWIRDRSFPARGADGVLRLVGIAEDITERREAESALRNSEQYLRALIQHSTDIFTVLEEDFTIRDTSPSVAPQMGWDPLRVTGVDALSLLHPDDVEPMRELLRVCAGDPGLPCAAEYRIRNREGKWQVHEAVITSLLEHPAVLGIVVTSRDVTDRRRQEEEALRMAEIVRTTSDAIVSKSLDGTVLSWNPAAERMLGWSEAEMVGASILRVVPPERHEEEVAILARAAQGELVNHYETDRICKDGRVLRVSLTVSPFPDAEGRITGISTVARDITGQRRLEEQLRAAQKMEAVGRLAGGVAHDFNNLLTAIRGNAALLLADLPEGDILREDVAEIDRAAVRAAELTRQLLAFSRRQVLQPRVLDPNAAVRDMQRMLTRLIEADVDLVVALAPRVPSVRADPGQMEQVIVNLVVNARDATPQGGQITVATGEQIVDMSKHHVPPYVAPGRYVRLSVSDTGSGIDPQVMEHLFEPFFTTKPAGKGTGLGLSTVYGIIKQSEGYVWAESDPGEGSRFVVLLPSVDEPAPQESAVISSAPREMTGSRGTVLIVEDEDAVRTLARRALERAGMRVLEARSAAAALEVAAREPVLDLLLTDVVMPGGSGSLVARQLGDRYPGLRVLFMSGYPGEAIEELGLGRDADLIPKPFSPSELAERVAEVLGRAVGEARV